MFQHFKQKDRVECIERIHRLNYNLDMLVKPTTIFENKLHKSVPGHYQRVRKHATILYSALKEMFQTSSCACNVCTTPFIHSSTRRHFLSFILLTTISLDEQIPHIANLQLGVRNLNIDNRNQRLSLWFHDQVEQETLHKLEFENPVVEPTSDEKSPKHPEFEANLVLAIPSLPK